MRIPFWPVLVCGGLLATVVGQTAFAFGDGYIDASPVVSAAGADSSDLFTDPSYEGPFDGAPAYQPAQYMSDPAAGMGFAGAPGGTVPPPNAWPNISPYTQHNWEGYYNDQGLWNYEANDDRTRALLSLEFLIVWGVKPGNHLIGSQLSDFVAARTISSEPQFLSNVFPNQTTSNFNDMSHYGVKARYGWENPDKSGFIVSGFYAAEKERTVGADTPHDNPIFGAPNGDPLNPNLQALASITFQQPGGGGNQVTYDTSFLKTYDQQFWGADANFYMAPFFKRPSFTAQMLYGVQYLRIWESLSVNAVDSSLGYTVSIPSGEIGNIVDLGFPQLQTTINSQVTSNLVGPQIGVRYDLGGDKFKIWGQSKVAVAVNMDNARVFGANAIDFIDRGLFGPRSFNNSVSHTHISPIFDQSIYGEFPLFSILPLVNRLSFINRANFRIGFNYILVGEMARPANVIVYTYGNPTVNADRTTFSLKTLSFAVDWRW
ncbi:MAG: BBP7 family outer membrane beta-barrel protein [Planctomycetaceae bacterium]